ncbi:bifunctional protein farnesyltransferase/protein geranylgeranyltransferase KNAG_0H00200 [Huiozyma naganishii CBS 8797]|uniref:Protein farnesyltransferase/geranylgeranyltransferase type-1 subunit alpha n=1 Tax=Huiozyma naganishii (strain ATCC MYA-139 / BCRC 22969 / CBS 8797 / KCTC 17520 / NBRC 10181 / NCYC 3082 / Yp74L-3) TaxID=1071383 RepID=J7S9C2_HUIN7|nr:hypothetical protein KNAG_0H00200 [Kazachstania naganishii CBS 8797]CCK71436.1 hypothetical protein KNAG_0H00200 [Kazachstania naganishii CBS 8797]
MTDCYDEFNLEDYADVEPLPIVTGLKDELCQIMYSEEYKQLMGLMRAFLSSNELTPRAMRLTARVIAVAPAFYTAWNYRFNIVVAIAKDRLDQEFQWLDEVTLNNPKNYQIWSYRQALVENLGQDLTLRGDLPIMDMMLDDDTKNYHVWSYRKWAVLHFKDFTHELSFVDKLIDRDVYNNSAWNHRMFYMKNVSPDDRTIDEEITYTKNKIELVPQNISSWNYLRGLYDHFKPETGHKGELLKFAGGFIDALDLNATADSAESLPEIESSYALEFLASEYATEGQLQRAKNAYQCLALKYDPIRGSFWNYKITTLEA